MRSVSPSGHTQHGGENKAELRASGSFQPYVISLQPPQPPAPVKPRKSWGRAAPSQDVRGCNLLHCQTVLISGYVQLQVVRSNLLEQNATQLEYFFLFLMHQQMSGDLFAACDSPENLS